MKKVILIMTDSQGVNLLGKSGENTVRTPNIDKLAERGVNFTHAYTTCPLCTPARAGIFTGLYPHTAGAWANSMPLGENIRHMGEYFSDAGYDCGYVGKWHLDGWDYFGTGEAFRGWDGEYWFDLRNRLDELGREKTLFINESLKSLEDMIKYGVSRELTRAAGVTERALDFMDKHHDKPYLLVVSYDEPHGPSVCPSEFAEMYVDDIHVEENLYDDLTNKPQHHRNWAGEFDKKKLTDQRIIKACTTFTDEEIGKIVNAADDDTLIVFTSDHGHYMGAHSLDTKGPALYEEVIRIPLIFAGGDLPCGQVNASVVSHIDILPTLLDCIGSPAYGFLQGEKLPLNNRSFSKGTAFCEFNRMSMYHDGWFGFTPIRCIIKDDYKLVINLFQTDELYCLKDDPNEMENLIEVSELDSIKETLLNEIITR